MNDWVIGLILASILATVCIGAFLRLMSIRRDDKDQLKALQDLVHQTGLSFNSNFIYNSRTWTVEGEYHGYHLQLWKTSYYYDEEEGRAPPYPSIQGTTLWLNNSSSCSLALQKKGILETTVSSVFSSGNKDFDRCFSIKGEPDEFVRVASNLIVQSDQRLLEWIIQDRPSIELKPPDLFFRQNRLLKDAQTQIALLDLLCKIADLAESWESECTLVKHT